MLAVPQLIHNNQSLTNDQHFDTANAGLFLVADGMGGGIHGEIASRIVRECIHEYAVTHKEMIGESIYTLINDCIYYANEKLLNHIKENPEDKTMGSTLVMCIIYNNQLHLGWVGDSRCYHLSNSGQMTRLTHDHSYVQSLVDSGKISEEEAFHHPNKNVITQSMGMVNMVPSTDTFSLDQTFRILLCSDGLNTMLTDDEIQSFLQGQAHLDKVNKQLIDAANESGGEDNITSIIIELLPIEKVQIPVLDTKDIATKPKGKISKGQIILGLTTMLLTAIFILLISKLQYSNNDKPDSDVVYWVEPDEETFGITGEDAHITDQLGTNSETIDEELLDSMFSASGIIPEPDSYYIRLNVYMDKWAANRAVNILKKANAAIDVQMVSTSEGLFEVCLFGFDTKYEAQEFLANHPSYRDAVIIFKN